MEKIPTIFDRDWNGNRGVVPNLLRGPNDWLATEKLDGTNVRVTVRTDAETPGGPNSLAVPVRLEKRRNPTKEQKTEGIKAPWYVDASRDDPADRFLFEALDNTPLLDIPDGEWSAEAVGPKIQGNPLKLDAHRLFFFAIRELPYEVCVPVLDGVPQWLGTEQQLYDDLHAYLVAARSAVNPAVGIEGIVWHDLDGGAGKLKLKDFKGAA